MMKLSLIAAMLMLCACAEGSSADLEEEPVNTTVDTKIPVPSPAPVAPEESDAGPAIQCKINAYWVGNCYVVKIYCKDKPTQVEVACGRGRPLWPWERDPYPPPYDQPGDNH